MAKNLKSILFQKTQPYPRQHPTAPTELCLKDQNLGGGFGLLVEENRYYSLDGIVCSRWWWWWLLTKQGIAGFILIPRATLLLDIS